MFTDLFSQLDKMFSKFTSSNSTIHMGGYTVRMSDGDIFVNGKKIDGVEKEFPKDETEHIKDGETRNINGDICGNLTCVGNNITVVVNGDVVGNILGASKVSVNGDHVGSRYG